MQFVTQDTQTKYSIYDKEGNIRSKSMLVCSEKGWGKSMLSETITEKMFKEGVVCICIGDPKNQLELAYASFTPEKKYHLADLKKTGRKAQTLPIKIYHPFTFNIPKNKKLFPMELYTVPIKEFTREMWSFICETPYSNDTIRTLITKAQRVSDKDDIYDYLHEIQDGIMGFKGKNKLKFDKELFALQTTSATDKTLQDIASFFQAFKLYYFISGSDNPLALDIVKICNDNSKIHYFPNYFIEDSKMRAFIPFMIYSLIIKNQNYINKKVFIYMPEIKNLFPARPRGYQEFIVGYFRGTLNLIRSQGVGISFLADTQSFSDVNTAITNNLEHIFIGQTKSSQDLFQLQKAYKITSETTKQIVSMPTIGSYLIVGEDKSSILKPFLPCFMHCEEEYNFYKMFKKHYPEKMVNYSDIWNQRRKQFDEQANKYETLMQKRIEEMEKQDEAKKEKKNSKKEIKEKATEEVQKTKEKLNQSKDKIKQLVYETKVKEDLSFRQLGIKFSISKNTAQKYYEELKDINENKRYDEEVLE